MATLFVVDLFFLVLVKIVPVQQMITPIIKFNFFGIGELKYISKSNCSPLTVPINYSFLSCIKLGNFS